MRKDRQMKQKSLYRTANLGGDPSRDIADINERRRLAMLGANDGPIFQDELEDLTAGCRRVYLLMKDGRWHSASAIRLAAGGGDQEASEGLRRLREIRQIGCTFEKRRIEDSRLFEYRLVDPDE